MATAVLELDGHLTKLCDRTLVGDDIEVPVADDQKRFIIQHPEEVKAQAREINAAAAEPADISGSDAGRAGSPGPPLADQRLALDADLAVLLDTTTVLNAMKALSREK